MNEVHLILKDWHVLGLIAALFALIFRSQLTAFLDTFVVVVETKLKPGDHLEIMYMDGKWTRAKIIKFTYTIPLIRAGGIYLEHQDEEGEKTIEKLSYSVFRYCRKRWLPGKV